jgi:putrescine importer
MSFNENKTATQSTNGDPSSPHSLNRVLGLWDIVVYGMILMQLVSPVPIYGMIQSRSGGNALSTIIFALFAILFTGLSYRRKVTMFLMAGSAYAYVA